MPTQVKAALFQTPLAKHPMSHQPSYAKFESAMKNNTFDQKRIFNVQASMAKSGRMPEFVSNNRQNDQFFDEVIKNGSETISINHKITPSKFDKVMGNQQEGNSMAQQSGSNMYNQFAKQRENSQTRKTTPIQMKKQIVQILDRNQNNILSANVDSRVNPTFRRPAYFPGVNLRRRANTQSRASKIVAQMTAEKTDAEATAEVPPVVVTTAGTDNKDDNPDHFDEVFQEIRKIKKPYGKKRVVIIGSSFSGRLCSQYLLREMQDQLGSIEIMMIDKSSHFEFICSNYKTLCDDGGFESLTADHSTSMDPLNRGAASLAQKNETELKENPVDFVQGLLTSINPEQNTCIVRKADEYKTEQVEIEYDALVVATGAAYPAPWRDGAQTFKSNQERKQDCTDAREDIRNAKSVLIIGAGNTGVETAAYMAEKYPNKKVGVADIESKLLFKIPGAHDMVKSYLESDLNVNVHTGVKPASFEETMKNLGYDHYVNCTGFRFIGPRKFMTEELADCLDPRSGQIQVNEHCQVTNKHPLIDQKDKEQKTYDNLFAFGDVCITKANEGKNILSLYQYKQVVAKNIAKQLRANGKPVASNQYEKVPESFGEINIVPIGSKQGLMVINDFVIMNPVTAPMKQIIESEYMNVLKSNPLADFKDELKAQLLSTTFEALKLAPFNFTDLGTMNKKKMERNEKDKEMYKEKLLQIIESQKE